jgi:hypothetical protein
MRVAGVQSYRIGKFSETLFEKASADELANIPSEALTGLRPWLSGGYRII